MLPLDNKPWAPTVARIVIAGTLLALAAFAILIRSHRPLDAGEIAFIILAVLAVVPPNVAIIRRHATGTPPPDPDLKRPRIAH